MIDICLVETILMSGYVLHSRVSPKVFEGIAAIVTLFELVSLSLSVSLRLSLCQFFVYEKIQPIQYTNCIRNLFALHAHAVVRYLKVEEKRIIERSLLKKITTKAYLVIGYFLAFLHFHLDLTMVYCSWLYWLLVVAYIHFNELANTCCRRDIRFE